MATARKGPGCRPQLSISVGSVRDHSWHPGLISVYVLKSRIHIVCTNARILRAQRVEVHQGWHNTIAQIPLPLPLSSPSFIRAFTRALGSRCAHPVLAQGVGEPAPRAQAEKPSMAFHLGWHAFMARPKTTVYIKLDMLLVMTQAVYRQRHNQQNFLNMPIHGSVTEQLQVGCRHAPFTQPPPPAACRTGTHPDPYPHASADSRTRSQP